ncbi:MAG: hypothetical protein ACXVJD_17825 [Mucilaginibacter sp.]
MGFRVFFKRVHNADPFRQLALEVKLFVVPDDVFGEGHGSLVDVGGKNTQKDLDNLAVSSILGQRAQKTSNFTLVLVHKKVVYPRCQPFNKKPRQFIIAGADI